MWLVLGKKDTQTDQHDYWVLGSIATAIQATEIDLFFVLISNVAETSEEFTEYSLHGEILTTTKLVILNKIPTIREET